MELKRLKELAGVLNEAKDYSDSAEFTEDYMTVLDNIKEIGKIINTKKWDNWMKVTEANFDVKTVKANDDLKTHFKALNKAADTLELQMNKADEG